MMPSARRSRPAPDWPLSCQTTTCGGDDLDQRVHPEAGQRNRARGHRRKHQDDVPTTFHATVAYSSASPRHNMRSTAVTALTFENVVPRPGRRRHAMSDGAPSAAGDMITVMDIFVTH